MPEDKQTRIEALFRSYRESLPALMVEIESMWESLNIQWEPELAAEFDRKVHGLAGSAATFDLEVIGNVARELEHAFKTLLEDNSDSDCLAVVVQLLQKLKETIQSNLN